MYKKTNVKKKIAFKMLPKCFVIKIDKLFPFHIFSLPFCTQPKKYIQLKAILSLFHHQKVYLTVPGWLPIKKKKVKEDNKKSTQKFFFLIFC